MPLAAVRSKEPRTKLSTWFCFCWFVVYLVWGRGGGGGGRVCSLFGSGVFGVLMIGASSLGGLQFALVVFLLSCDYWCLFLSVHWVGLWSVPVVFPGHNHLLTLAGKQLK